MSMLLITFLKALKIVHVYDHFCRELGIYKKYESITDNIIQPTWSCLVYLGLHDSVLGEIWCHDHFLCVCVCVCVCECVCTHVLWIPFRICFLIACEDPLAVKGFTSSDLLGSFPGCGVPVSTSQPSVLHIPPVSVPLSCFLCSPCEGDNSLPEIQADLQWPRIVFFLSLLVSSTSSSLALLPGLRWFLFADKSQF